MIFFHIYLMLKLHLQLRNNYTTGVISGGFMKYKHKGKHRFIGLTNADIIINE